MSNDDFYARLQLAEAVGLIGDDALDVAYKFKTIEQALIDSGKQDPNHTMTECECNLDPSCYKCFP